MNKNNNEFFNTFVVFGWGYVTIKTLRLGETGI